MLLPASQRVVWNLWPLVHSVDCKNSNSSSSPIAEFYNLFLDLLCGWLGTGSAEGSYASISCFDAISSYQWVVCATLFELEFEFEFAFCAC